MKTIGTSRLRAVEDCNSYAFRPIGVGMGARLFVYLLAVWGASGRRSPLLRPHRDVMTTQGAARGYLVGGATPYFAYFGLPYARPPTRHDRYKAPKPPPSWDGLFEATHRIKCPQLHATGEENCLVVNVFASEQAAMASVLVLVHGGAFQSGWGPYRPPVQLMREGFVIVTFNYRIGALGFLCLGFQDASGNVGLKDQIAALYWINRNIGNFGGNPQDVTVYGIGSGAAAIQLILLSGLADGLIHKVIVESGSALAPTSMNYDPLLVALGVANRLGYDGKYAPSSLVQFYQNIPADKLITIPDLFLPCVQNDSYSLLESDPVHVLKYGNYQKLPLLVALSDSEGFAVISGDMAKFKKPPERFEHLLPNDLEFDSSEAKKKLGGIVKDFYFGDDNTEGNILQSYADYLQDVFTEYPLMKFAMLYAAKSPHSVYVLKINIEELGKQLGAYAPHGITVLDIFSERRVDEFILNKLMTLWKNFINMSDPTPIATTQIPIIWQPVPSKPQGQDISNIPILHFPSLQMGPPPVNKRLIFWDNIYDRFYRLHDAGESFGNHNSSNTQ